MRQDLEISNWDKNVTNWGWGFQIEAKKFQIGAEQLNPGVHSYKLFTSKIVVVDFKSV